MFKKILVPYDGSQMAAKIFPQVAALAKTCNSRVTFIYVFHTDKVWDGTPGMLAEIPEKALKSCENFLSEAGGELQKNGVEADWVCIEGVPAREIIQYADANTMDVIAMATHGRGEIAWVLGSVAEQVVTHSNTPVLLFRVIETRPPRRKEEVVVPPW
jgi:nucleotide-binding universal stress UspA family protein